MEFFESTHENQIEELIFSIKKIRSIWLANEYLCRNWILLYILIFDTKYSKLISFLAYML